MGKNKKAEKKTKKSRKAENTGIVAPSEKLRPKAGEGKTELIERLNYALSLEYAALIQYLNQHCVVKGLDRQDFAPFFATSSNEAHLHAQNLGNKIVALGGVPTVAPAAVRATEALSQMLKQDLELEKEALGAYVRAWEAAEGNHSLRFWLENIIQEEQLHVDELAKLAARRS